MIFSSISRRAARILAVSALYFSTLQLPASASPPAPPDVLHCTATSILPRLRVDQPEHYRAYLKEAQSIRNGKHILWKIEKKGLKPSWLFGTMHLSDPRILMVPPNAFEAFDKIDNVLVELKEVLDPRLITFELLKHPELTMLMGDSIDHLLPSDEIATLSVAMKQRGVPLDLVARMRPWFLAFSMQTSACEAEARKAGKIVLDQAVAKKAVENKINLVGLETPLEQFQALSRISDTSMLEYLRQSLAQPYSDNDQLETAIELYRAHDVGKMIALNSLLFNDSDANAQYTRYLIDDRNKIMAERAKPYLDKGRTMIAVGAAHLAGDQGLVELIRKQGFTVTAAD